MSFTEKIRTSELKKNIIIVTEFIDREKMNRGLRTVSILFKARVEDKVLIEALPMRDIGKPVSLPTPTESSPSYG
jgi:hypothetical protein